jgi:hypothetical protein
MLPTREPALQEICAQRPRLLRAERLPPRAVRSVLRARLLLLSFDRLQLSVRPDVGTRSIELATGASLAGVLEDLIRADEEEPWWMLIGAPLVAAWRTPATDDVEGRVDLQFREDGSNPKIVGLQLASGQIRISAQPKADWLARREAEPETNDD